MDDRGQAAVRLRLALAMHDEGVAMMRLNLVRRHPDEDDAQIDARLDAWLLTRPGAIRGDADTPAS
ncbi:hypothetical protein BH23ACT9_BH23ACT9_29150 [soil metagenome]